LKPGIAKKGAFTSNNPAQVENVIIIVSNLPFKFSQNKIILKIMLLLYNEYYK